MGGIYRVFVNLQVNEKKNLECETLRVLFCHNWAGDDWFIRLQFKRKETNRIYYQGNYGKFYVFERIVKRFVKEFIVEEKRATFKRINQIVKEIAGNTPKWSK